MNYYLEKYIVYLEGKLSHDSHVILCIYSGIIQKHYKDILDGFRSVILDVIFDVEKLQQFFSGKNEKVQKMLKLGNVITNNTLPQFL